MAFEALIKQVHKEVNQARAAQGLPPWDFDTPRLKPKHIKTPEELARLLKMCSAGGRARAEKQRKAKALAAAAGK